MSFLLPSAEYDSIRDVLGLNATELPTAVIERTPFLPSAEAWVKEQVPDYADLTGDDEIRLNAAIIYRTAALLCDRSKNLYREGDRLADYTAGKMDWEALKATCLTECQQALEGISTYSATAPTLVLLAGVSRTVKARRQTAEGTLTEDIDFENI